MKRFHVTLDVGGDVETKTFPSVTTAVNHVTELAETAFARATNLEDWSITLNVEETKNLSLSPRQVEILRTILASQHRVNHPDADEIEALYKELNS